MPLKTEDTEIVANDPIKTLEAMDLIATTFNTNSVNKIDGMTALVMCLVLEVQKSLRPGATLEEAVKELTDQAIGQARMHKIQREMGGYFDARFASSGVH